jgi:tetratricopeptide (TPR) repeat protein
MRQWFLPIDLQEEMEPWGGAAQAPTPEFVEAPGKPRLRRLPRRPGMPITELSPPFQAPPPPTPFLGRRGEVNELRRRLRRGQPKIVAILGPEGVGKTTLAAFMAQSLRDQFPDGVLWIYVGDRNPMLILSDIARSYGYDVSTFADLEKRSEAIRSILADKEALLILDHVTDHAVPNLPYLLPDPSTATLVTSPARILPGLPLGSGPQLKPLARDVALEYLRHRLGGERVSGELGAARQLCQAMVYVPLALELAAGYLREAPQMQLADYVELFHQQQRLLIDRGLRGLGAIDVTVQTGLNLSCEALTPEQRARFRRLWVLAQPDFDAATVAALGDEDEETARQGLDEMVRRAMIQRAAEGRYWLHPLLQAYGRNQAQEFGEDRALRLRHARYFLDYALARQTPERYPELELERDDLLEAMHWARHADECELLLAYIMALDDYFASWGYWDIDIHWLEQGLEICRQRRDKKCEAAIMHNLAMVYAENGDHARARRYYEGSIKIALEAGDKAGAADSMSELGYLCQQISTPEEPRRCFNKALAIWEDLGNEFEQAHILHELGVLAHRQGDFSKAADYYHRSLELREQIGDKRGAAATLHALGVLAYDQGDHELARQYYERSLVLSEDLEDPWGMAATLPELGDLACEMGDHGQAHDFYHRGLVILEDLGDRAGIAHLLHNLGDCAAHTNPAAAPTYYERSLAVSQELGDRQASSANLYALGTLAFEAGQTRQAKKYFSLGLRLARQSGDRRLEAHHLAAQAQLALQDGNRAEARRLYEESLAISRRLGLSLAERVQAALQEITP